MKKCEAMQELISRMLDEDLDAAEQRELAEHLKSCADCRAMYEAFSALSGELQSDLVEPPESLRETVMSEIRREQIRAKNRRPWRYALTVAAMAALVIGIHFAAGNRMAADLSKSVEIAASAQPFEATAGGGLMMYAANSAVEEESTEAMKESDEAEMASALPVYDRQEQSWEDFLASAAGKQRSQAAADTAPSEALVSAAEEPELFAELRLAEGSVLLRSRGEELFAEEPGSGALVTLSMTKSEFEAAFGEFLSSNP